MKKGLLFFLIVSMSVFSTAAWAGSYVYEDDCIAGFVDGEVNPIFVGWATGYINYLPADGVSATWQTPEEALGEVTGSNTDIVSLGDLSQDDIDSGAAPGEITLTFDSAITNGDGFDFAVFENGFWSGSGMFAELGYVEVSTDGEYWAQFGSVSLTEGLVGGYGTIDPTDVYNLVGKHANAYGTSEGTGFNLDDLISNELVLAGLVDLNEINYVKIIDIPGSGDYLDSDGNPIYDAWETWGSGGVDLEAVGVINAVPVPGAFWLMGSAVLAIAGVRRKKAVI